MDTALLGALAVSLALTLILETIIFLLFGKRNKKDLLLLVLVNVLTNPVVVLLYWLAASYTKLDTYVVQIPLEVFAILTEGYCYKIYGQDFKRPYAFAVAANVFSYGMGIIFQCSIIMRRVL